MLVCTCSSRKYPCPPHGRLIEIPTGRGGGGGVEKPDFLNESMAVKWNFRRGGGFNLKNLPWEGYGYFLERHNHCHSWSILPSSHFFWKPYINIYCNFGSCVLKTSVERVSVDTLGRYVGQHIDRHQSTRMSADTRPIFHRHSAATYPILIQYKLHYICIRNGGSLSYILPLSTHEHRRKA